MKSAVYELSHVRIKANSTFSGVDEELLGNTSVDGSVLNPD